MKAAAARLEKSAFNYWLLLALAAACLVASILTGVASGIVTAFPWPASRWMSLRALRPAHTLFALAWVIFGSAACVGLFAARNGVGRLWTSRLQIVFFNAFLFGSLVAAARGSYSGREYVTWPPAMSLPLIAGLVLVLANIVAAWKPIHGHSPEAAWLLSTGAVLLPAGLVEQYLYLLPRIAADPGRDLVVQWHALDTLIAAWCLLLYGVGVLLAPAGTRALRGGWLFALAMIGILLDFGHHNYPSPQPYLVKFVSFTASMLAAVSFLRHARAFRRTTRSSDSLPGLLRQIEIWTLFAVGSGILLAVPYVNLYLHGTYAIVGHTMGAMIGVNSSSSSRRASRGPASRPGGAPCWSAVRAPRWRSSASPCSDWGSAAASCASIATSPAGTSCCARSTYSSRSARFLCPWRSLGSRWTCCVAASGPCAR